MGTIYNLQSITRWELRPRGGGASVGGPRERRRLSRRVQVQFCLQSVERHCQINETLRSYLMV